MNKYLMLLICFIGSLLLVTYDDNSDVRDKVEYQDSIYVFNEIGENNKIIDNPDTRDIKIYVYFIIAFYSLLFIIITLKNLKKVNKYVNIKEL